MQLALHGGAPAVSRTVCEYWKDITDKEIAAVTDYMRSKPISVADGGVMAEFEQRFAQFVGSHYAVAFSNGTAALHAAFFAIGGDFDAEVIIPAYGFHGIAVAALQAGRKVVFCDIDPNTLTLSPQSVTACCTSHTVAIVALHTWGNPADMDELEKVAAIRGIPIITDAAHAHGATWNGMRLGALPMEQVGCFSMGLGKLITGGELGIAVTNDARIRDALLLFGHVNRVPAAFETDAYRHLPNSVGPKYRPHALAMVIALSQIDRYEEKMRRNIEVSAELEAKLDQIPGFARTHTYPKAQRVYWRLPILIEREEWPVIPASRILQALKAEGVPLSGSQHIRSLNQFALWTWEQFQGRVLGLHPTPHANRADQLILVLPAWIDVESQYLQTVVDAFWKVWRLRHDLT